MKKILLALLVSLFMFSSANAYFINFDATGSGVDANLVAMDEWQMTAFSEVDPLIGQVGDIFTHQSIATGAFVEDFTMNVTGGRNSTLPSTNPLEWTAFPPFYADVNLTGNYYSDQNIKFNTGNVVVYQNATNDGIYDLGTDTMIAELTLTSALTSQLTGSLLGAGNLGMAVDLNFKFDTVNPAFFGETEEDLTDMGWLLSVVAGRVDQEDLDVHQDLYVIRWDNPGFQAEFSAVPEPATYLLLGAGMVGLAFYRRRNK